MIMLGFMETEKEFIKNWEKYRGAAGCLRYLAYWFLFGIIVIPLMLTAINPDIWSTVRMDQLAGEAAPFFGAALPRRRCGWISGGKKLPLFSGSVFGFVFFLPCL